MELHTRDAEDAVALAQLGAAAIILWHNVPRGMQADLLHVAETITGVPTVPTLDSCCSVLLRAINSLASDQ